MTKQSNKIFLVSLYPLFQEEINSEQLSSQDQDQVPEILEIPTVTRNDLLARREDVQIDVLRQIQPNDNDLICSKTCSLLQ